MHFTTFPRPPASVGLVRRPSLRLGPELVQRLVRGLAPASLLLLMACGPGSLPAGNPDSGAPDAGTDSSPGDPCANLTVTPPVTPATPPVGTQLQQGEDLAVRGVTSDGWVVYADDAAHTLHAMPLAGGAAQDLGALGDKYWVMVDGKDAFIWSNVTGNNVGALSVWNSVAGLHALAPASFGLLESATSDGGLILYLANVDAQGETGDVMVAAGDGTSPTKLVGGATIDGCFPQLGFAGSSAVVSHCSAKPTGAPNATISTFDMTKGWAGTDLVTDAQNYWWTDAAGDKVFVSKSPGVFVVPTGGGTPETIDANGFLGVLTSDGKTALYSTMSQGLRRSPVSAPSPVTLVDKGFGGIWALSPDEAWLLFFYNLGSNGGDMFLSSTSVPGTPTTLSQAVTSAVSGDAFTADSHYALYVGSLDVCTSAGTLTAVPVSGGAPITLGERAWADHAAGGSRVVFVDDFSPTSVGAAAATDMRYGRADVELVDLAKGSTVTRLVDQADAVVALSPAQDSLVYTWSAEAGAKAGLYVLPLP